MDVMIEYDLVEGMDEEADRVRAVFLDEAARWRPDRFTYRVLRKGPEGSSFVHLAWIDSKETQQELFETDFFKEFDAGMQKVSGGTVHATPLFEWSPAE